MFTYLIMLLAIDFFATLIIIALCSLHISGQADDDAQKYLIKNDLFSKPEQETTTCNSDVKKYIYNDEICVSCGQRCSNDSMLCEDCRRKITNKEKENG